jgi:hypothetical protein
VNHWCYLLMYSEVCQKTRRVYEFCLSFCFRITYIFNTMFCDNQGTVITSNLSNKSSKLNTALWPGKLQSCILLARFLSKSIKRENFTDNTQRMSGDCESFNDSLTISYLETTVLLHMNLHHWMNCLNMELQNVCHGAQ